MATKTGRRWPAIFLILLLALAYMAVGQTRNPGMTGNEHDSEIRMPVANPPLEPSRPDLFAEPRITDDDDVPQH